MKNIVLFTHVLPQKQYNKHSDNMDINKNQKKNLFVQTIEEVKKINQEQKQNTETEEHDEQQQEY